MWFSPAESRNLDLLADDVVVVEGGAGYGRSATLVSNLEGWGFQNSINRIRPSLDNEGRFIDYCLKAALASGYIEVVCGVATIPHLTAEKLSAERIPLPPPAIQRAVCHFLDRETAKIDALIAKQEQLIATLREDRAATISDAVTKGLNPDVEMKEAEAPWIGEIPAHWGATKFSRLGKFTSGSGFPHEYQGQADNEIAFLKVNALGRANHSGYITTRDDTVSPGTARELGAKIFDANTVVFAKVGAALLLGRICLTASKSCIDNNMMAFAPNSSILPEYARYLLQQIPFDLLVNPGAVPSVNEGQLRGLPAARPPVAEQLAIVSHLAERCQKIDVLIDVSIEMIETLREYRSALITNAVTGKIDVREAV
jgi:type I restriction enzyme S subunit